MTHWSMSTNTFLQTQPLTPFLPESSFHFISQAKAWKNMILVLFPESQQIQILLGLQDWTQSPSQREHFSSAAQIFKWKRSLLCIFTSLSTLC